MIAFIRNIRQILQPFKFKHLFGKVFVHIPHIDDDAELVRMWFSHHTDGINHRRALAFRKPSESTRLHHLFDGARHKLFVLERC